MIDVLFTLVSFVRLVEPDFALQEWLPFSAQTSATFQASQWFGTETTAD